MAFPRSLVTFWLLSVLLLLLAASGGKYLEKDLSSPSLEDINAAPKQHGRTVIDDELEDLRTLIVEGLPAMDIPVLDPLRAERYDFSVRQEPALAADVSLREVRVEGFASFATQTLQPAAGVPVPPNPTVWFTLTVPVVNATGQYSARGHTRLKGHETTIHGDGPFSCQVENLVIDVKMELSITFKLRSVRVQMTLGDIHVKVEGGGEVSEMLNSEASTRLERWFVYAAPRLEEKAELFVQYYIRKKVTEEPMWLLNKMKNF